MAWINFSVLLRIIYALIFIFFTLPVMSKETLVFATHTRPPLSLYLKEVMQEALKPYSIEIEMLEMAGSRVIAQVNNGKIDGDLSRVSYLKDVSDLDTSNYLLVNEAIVLTELVLITLAQKVITLPITWESINHGRDRVAYLRGSKTIRSNLNIDNRVALNSSLQVLEMVANKRVDSGIMFKSMALKLFNQFPELNEKLTMHTPSIVSLYLYTYLNKKHALLIPKLEISLRQLKASGFLARTADKYQVTAAGSL